MCPYYLDGDLRAAYAALGDTRFIGYCAVFKDREEGEHADCVPVSQNSTACEPPRARRVASSCGLPGPVDISSGRTRLRRAPRSASSAAILPRVRCPEGLPRKEVIQPQLPLRLPCYDFTPVASPTFDGALQKVRPPASGIADFRGVTGGVYKAREHIHRGVADPRLLATPPSWRRVSASNPNRDRLFGIRSPSRVCSPLYRPM